MDSSTDARARGGLPQPRLATYDGDPALFIPRWTGPARTGRAILVGLVVLLALAALWALVAFSWLGAVLLLVVAGVVAAIAVRDARTIPYDGGVWLTPSGVTHRWGGRAWSVPWDDVVQAHLDHREGDLLLDVRSRPEPCVVSTHLLVLSPGALMLLLEHYRDHPERRTTLGTEESLAHAEQVRRDAQPVEFRPSVHSAPRTSPGLVLGATLVAVVVLLGLIALGRATG